MDTQELAHRPATASTPVPSPQRMVRMASGKMVPASTSVGMHQTKVKKLLLVLQFYEGDRDAAEQLASLIADLERTRCHDADVMLMRRADSRELSVAVRGKLESKFDKVLLHACRRTDAKNYPYGPNCMFHDLCSLMAQVSPYRDDYYAFIPLETDCVPTRPGWIGELIAAYRTLAAGSKAAVGFIHDNPTPHLNGLAIYAADLHRRVGGNKLSGGNPAVAYDIWHSPTILPLAAETPLIFFKYRQPTITPEELFAPQKGDVAPALYHGVKDGSARAAVRARHISFADKKEVKRPNVYTYFRTGNTPTNPESDAILDLWSQGWASRGWNPVILSLREAARHPKYPAFSTAIAKLPFVGSQEASDDLWLRWLALDGAGGGMLVDCDVLPDTLTPKKVSQEGGVLVLRSGERLLGMFLNKDAPAKFVQVIIGYDAQPDDMINGRPSVSDDTVVRRTEWLSGQVTSEVLVADFADAAVKGERKSVAMEQFLSGK